MDRFVKKNCGENMENVCIEDKEGLIDLTTPDQIVLMLNMLVDYNHELNEENKLLRAKLVRGGC